jgi:probable phosphoglycerate mutase
VKLILVRHGETSANVDMVIDSRPPGPPLTEVGRQQALVLAEAFDEPVAAIYASTALRAQETAAPLAAKLGLAVSVVDGAQEIDCGALEGRHDREAYGIFLKTVTAWMEGDPDLPLPGGESGTMVLDRYLATVREISGRHGDGTVVLVSHGGAIRMAALALAPNVRTNLAEGGLLPNTGRIVLEGNGTGWTCTSWTGVDILVT